MKTPIYVLQGSLFRTQENLNDLVEINELFESENLIIAREKVFSKFQTYLDVFLQSLGVQYESHNQAKICLNDFVDSYIIEHSLNNPSLGQVETDFDKGLFIYFVPDSSDTFTTKEGELIYNKKYLIHYINKSDDFEQAVLNDLQAEFRYYNDNDYDTKDYKLDIDIQGLFEDKRMVSILETPIDFGKYSKIKL